MNAKRNGIAPAPAIALLRFVKPYRFVKPWTRTSITVGAGWPTRG
jgi:hypothetical protein